MIKKGSAEAKKFMASIRAKKKGAKKLVKQDVKMSFVSGDISKGKLTLINNLTFLYGRLSSEYLFATTQKEKNRLKKEMINIKKDIKYLKY